MNDIFGQAYTAAQKATGIDQWERVSDSERMRAIYEQIRRMDSNEVQRWPLFDDQAHWVSHGR